MPNVTITINTPILTGGDTFKVRHRLVGGLYSAPTVQTNAAFTLIGLAAGKYELEVVMVKSGIDCPPTVTTFTVPIDYTCVTFTPVIVQNGTLFDLQISYPAHVTPPCGWHIEMQGAQNNAIINYASLPASPLLIPVANDATRVIIRADLCDGFQKVCHDSDVPQITKACTPISGLSVTLVPVMSLPNNFYRFNLVFTFTQSNPPTTGFTVLGIQHKMTQGAIPTFAFLNHSYVVTPTTTSFAIQMDLNSFVLNNTYEVEWKIIDGCEIAQLGTAITIL